MPLTLSTTKTFTKGLFAGQIINNTLNPHLLSLATTLYHYQSTLGNPDQWGWFSLTPLCLQIHQAHYFIVYLFTAALAYFIAGFVVYNIRPALRPRIWEIGLYVYAGVTFYLGMVYVLGCTSKQRKVGYEWKDWKVHEK